MKEEVSSKSFQVKAIGRVFNDFEEEIPDGYKEMISCIKVYDEYTDCLKGIEEHSHITILSWFDRSDRTVKQVHPMGDPENPLTGVFATRSPVRPNPVAVTVCELKEREENELYVKGLDALNGTPIIDIKSYSSKYAIDNPAYPDWVLR